MKDQTVLITGASSGIGACFARALAAQGATLVLVARRQAQLEELAASLRAQTTVHVIPYDLGEPTRVQGLVDELVQRNIVIDMLVNNAGFGYYARFVDSDLEKTLRMIDLNIGSLVALSRLLVPGMVERKRGGIINVASTNAFQPMPYFSAYAASKTFVLAFSEALSEELRGTGVRVMALCPGPTRSDFTSTAEAHLHPLEHLVPYMEPEQLVDKALRDFRAGRVVSIAGLGNQLGAFGGRLAPRRLSGWLIGLTSRPKG